jgi:sec-independent protein translocase protein TatB
MFGVDSTEFAVVAILALIFIGPKDLPKVLRTVGYWVGRVRGMARHFTSGIENMVREAELEEMEKKWREENERIMRLNPSNAHYPEPGEPDEMPPVANPEAGEEAPPPASGRSPSPSNDGEDVPPEKRPLP